MALATGAAPLGANAYETEYGNAYADIKLRYEYADTDDTTDTAGGLITDAAIGFETKDYSGFKVLLEQEVIVALIEKYRTPWGDGDSDYDVIPDATGNEWNRAQVSFSKDGFGAVVGRQRIILDDSRFIGNVGWRANEQTFDAATVTYAKDALAVHYSFLDKVNQISEAQLDVSDHLINVSYKIGTGKLTGFAYLMENDDTEATRDTFGARYAGSSMAGETKIIYSGSFATQNYEAGATENDATYLALEGGAVFSGVTLALGNETLGSDDGTYAFAFPYGTNHKFNGWADAYLGGAGNNGLSDTYVKAAGVVSDVKLVGFYHTFSPVEGSAELGNEFDLLAVKKLDDTFTVGAKAAVFSGSDIKPDTTKMWAWVQAKF
ncbi:MAG: hypothetical protein CMI02_17295 [Oceanospirillaceae bacterium]|nr:hypothetical protein [Oceanospirillaceae bacterium]MBT13778.1 hypothetical protein [Oceanospirillaceae bacterium]